METKNREKLLLIATGGCLVLLLLNWLVISPLIASWHRRSDRIAALRKSIADGNVTLRRGGSILDRWERMRTNALSSTPTMAERQLFDAFDGWVRESRVTEGSFKPQLKQTDDNYSVYECRAEVTGTYGTIIRCLYDLEKDPMGLQLQGVELTSRDDSGQQLSLGLELSGLLLPPPNPTEISLPLMGAGLPASAQESNAVAALDWSSFESIAQKNIFDPTRSRGRGPRTIRPAPAIVRSFTFRGTIEDAAIFAGDGAGKGYLRCGGTINGFKVMKIPISYTDPVVVLTDPGGAIVVLKQGENMRREEDGPWTKSDQPAPAAIAAAAETTASDATASSSPASTAVSDILTKLRLKREQEEK